MSAGKKDILVFDDEQRGLGVRVTASGGKSYLAQYTFGGAEAPHPAWLVLGDFAGRGAQGSEGTPRRGCDRPRSVRRTQSRLLEVQRKADHEALTLGVLLEQWERFRLADRRERYAAEAVRAIKYAFAGHLKSPAAGLNRASRSSVLDALARDGKAAMAAERLPTAAPAIIGPSSVAR